MDNPKKIKRILLKLSGETLMGGQSFGIDQTACLQIAESIQRIRQLGLEVAIVIGGGNIFRGISLKDSGMPRTPADHMGMLATLMNGIALQQALESKGVAACVMTALECPRVAETYHWPTALKRLAEGAVLIFVGGTGNPYFTTDTAAALRASEIHADILLKATKVDGVYDKDPLKYKEAIKYDTLSYSQFLAEKLQVMDATAIALCRSSHVPLFIFNMRRLLDNTIEEVLFAGRHGTLIDGN